MRLPRKLLAAATATAVGASALVGVAIPAAQAALVDRPLINEYLADEDGPDTFEFVEVLIPEGYDITDHHIIGIEGDNNRSRGQVKQSYSLNSVVFDADGRGLLELPQNGLENGSLSLALVDRPVSRGTVVDAEGNGELDADLDFTVLDLVGIIGTSDGIGYGTAFRASDFPGFTGTLGGLARVPDGANTWMPLSYNGAGLPGSTAAPRGDFEIAATPGAPNGVVADDETDDNGTGEPGTEPSTEPTDEPGAVCEGDFTLISAVQGSGESTPLNGQTVTIQGVVTGDFFNANGGSNGFWVQEEEADYDGNPDTSEAVFVYNPRAEAPAQGTVVTVTGTAAEFYNQTQLTNVSYTECGTADLPAPVEITFPVEDDYEHLEGMLVTVPEGVVLETYQFGRYGEVVVGPERQFTPTAVHAPDTDEALELMESNLKNRITIDDGNSIQNYHPAMHLNGQPFTTDNYFRGGDTFRNITGVMDWRNNTWKIQRTQDADYENTNPRETEPPQVGGDIQVAAFNVLNYFTTFNSRGAKNAEEFQRQKDKLVTAIGKLDADVVGFMEIENNNDEALLDLVEGVNEYLGEDRYTALTTGMLGTDAITTALMYDASVVTPVGDHKVLDQSVDTRFDTNRHRPALAQTFTAAGDAGQLGEFTVVTNHLKSKGSECGSEATSNTDLVGSCNAERTAAAAAMVDWIADQDLPKPIVMGDLNFYDHETPMDEFVAGGYTDLKREYEGEYAYSYVFDGQLGYLDYALAHESVLPFVSGAASWHTNSDEVPVLDYQTRFNTDPAQKEIYEPNEFRSSDHDPVVFGLNLQKDLEQEPEEPQTPHVVINEVQSQGTDWVELANAGDTPADISGWWIIDNNDKNTPLVFPEGTILEPGAYFSVETNAGPDGFGLGSNDSVTLYDADGNRIDHTEWSGHADPTWGRIPDMTGEFTVTGQETRDAANIPATDEEEQPEDPTLPPVETRVVINEVESNGDLVGDWVELANTDPNESVDISGWSIIDNNDSHDHLVIPDGTVIESGGYYSMYTDLDPNGFGLGGNDSVTLFDQYKRQIDHTEWSGHATQTWGRIPDMTGEFQDTGKPTRNGPNVSAEDLEIELNTRPWPYPLTEDGVVDAVESGSFGDDLSGVDFDANGVAYVVNNGTGELHLFARNEGTSTYSELARYQLRYPDGTGTPDAEGMTVGADGVIYVATERNNDASNISRPSVLSFQLPAEHSLDGADLAATAEWNLNDHIGTQIGPNSGLEAIEWLPDVFGGVYAVGVEGTGEVLFVTLGDNGSSELVKRYEAPLQGVMALDYQVATGELLVLCDEVCGGRSVTLTFTDDEIVEPTNADGVVLNDRPEGMENHANEGFAIHRTAEQCVSGEGERVTVEMLWSDDAAHDGVALRAGRSETAPEGCDTAPEPGEDDEADEPTPAEELVLTVTPNAVADMGGITLAGDSLQLNGTLPQITVTDTRAGERGGWSLTGQSSHLVSGEGKQIAAGHLGWVPRVVSSDQNAQAGDPIANVLRGGEGLVTPQVLATGDAADGIGHSVIDANLQLNVPTTTAEGTYKGAISVSLFPVD